MKGNDNITNYDISILIDNIQRIMKEKGITQSELATAAGMDQPRISNIFKMSTSSCFNIQQLVAIANYFHVSVDSLLGVKASEQLKEEKEATLSDVCIKLFELDDLASVSFGKCGSGEYSPAQTAFDEPEEIQAPCIYFKNDSISSFISEWNEIKEMNVTNESIKNSLYTTWIKGSIEENKSKPKKWKYKDRHSHELEIAKRVVNAVNDPTVPMDRILLKEDEIKAFDEYMQSFSPCLEFDNRDDLDALHVYHNYLHINKI